MSIKGIREALAKKQAQQHPESRVADVTVPTGASTTRPAINKPPKKITGRGR